MNLRLFVQVNQSKHFIQSLKQTIIVAFSGTKEHISLLTIHPDAPSNFFLFNGRKILSD